MSRALVAVLCAVSLGLAGCGDDEPGKAGSGYDVPGDSFCGDLIDTAIPRPEREVVDSWFANGVVDGDDNVTTATCTFTGADHQVDVVVRVGAGAADQYDQTTGELEDGAVGFENPEVSPIEGWWAAGQRYEAVLDESSVRVADVVRGDNAFCRVQVVEFLGGKPRDIEVRRTQAVELAEAVTTAVPEALADE